jgi:predicted helicase
MIDYDRNELMRQMRNRNLGLLVSKMFDEHEFTSALATRLIVESKVADRTRGSYLFPLRLNASTAESSLDSRNQDSGRTNLTPAAIKAIGQQLGVTVRIGGSPRERLEITDLDVFSYVYAILYSADYRSRYLDFLKNDFPRLPLTGNRALFHRLIQLGGELVSLHLMESSKLKNFITNYSGPDNPRVERVGWAGDTVWLDAAATKKGQRATPGTVGFRGVSEAVWNFHIGGYKVCEKWLKDRKGRTLSHDDLAHYKKIVAALSETIRLMQEVDEVIEQYGGWPGAFAEPKEKAMVTDQVALIDKSHVSARPN